VIGDELEGCSSEVMAEMFDSPDNGEGFQLGGSIVSFSRTCSVGGIGNGFVVFFDHLGKNSS